MCVVLDLFLFLFLFRPTLLQRRIVTTASAPPAAAEANAAADMKILPLPYRIGHGFDLHRLEPGFKLIIGNVLWSTAFLSLSLSLSPKTATATTTTTITTPTIKKKKSKKNEYPKRE